MKGTIWNLHYSERDKKESGPSLSSKLLINTELLQYLVLLPRNNSKLKYVARHSP